MQEQTVRKMKCCPYCGGKSLKSSSRKKTYRCDKCGVIFRKTLTITKTVSMQDTKRLPRLLVEGIEKHRQKKAQEESNICNACAWYIQDNNSE